MTWPRGPVSAARRAARAGEQRADVFPFTVERNTSGWRRMMRRVQKLTNFVARYLVTLQCFGVAYSK